LDAAHREWMASKGVPVEGDFHAALKNGVKLCEYVIYLLFIIIYYYLLFFNAFLTRWWW
jgi:hypothetical protein